MRTPATRTTLANARRVQRSTLGVRFVSDAHRLGMHGPLNFLVSEFQPWNDELSLRLPWQQPRASFVWAVCWGNEKCSERLFPLSHEERGLDERACGIAFGIGQRSFCG